MKQSIPIVCIQWAITAALCAWCCILAIVIFGEESAEMQLSLFEFFVLKLMAAGAAYATYKMAGWCYRKGLLPAVVITYIEHCKEEEI